VVGCNVKGKRWWAAEKGRRELKIREVIAATEKGVREGAGENGNRKGCSRTLLRTKGRQVACEGRQNMGCTS
jgi:hypothetical protein